MSYKFHFRGIEVTCDSVSEMVAAVERLSAVNASPAQTQTPVPAAQEVNNSFRSGNATTAPRKKPVTQYVVDAFEMVRNSMPEGATSEDFTQALGLDHPKGIGSRLTPVRALLGRYNVEMGDAILSERTPDGVRMWKAGPQFEHAFQILKKLGSESLL